MNHAFASTRTLLKFQAACLAVLTLALASGCTQTTTTQSPAAITAAVTPNPLGTGPAADAWTRLMAGNTRYTTGNLQHPDQSADRRGEVAKGQRPLAIVLTCSDSRVPPEILFDMGLGDLFVIRVAGNTADNAAVGSMEYAVEHLHAPLIVVLGHTRCGAVQAAAERVNSHQIPEGHLDAILDPIAPAVAAAKSQGGDVVDRAVRENVLRVVQQLRLTKPMLTEALHARKLAILPCLYDLDSGRVTLLTPSTPAAGH